MNKNKSYKVYNLSGMNISRDAIGFSIPKRRQITFIEMKYNQEEFLFQIKNVVNVGGINRTSYKDYTMNFSINQEGYLKKFEELDNFLLKEARERVMDWFGEDFNDKVLKEKYIPCLRADEIYNPTLKGKVLLEFNRTCKAEFNYINNLPNGKGKSLEQIDYTDMGDLVNLVGKNKLVDTIVRLTGVYVRKDQERGILFGPTFKVIQVNVHSKTSAVPNPDDDMEIETSDSETYLSD